ncbi:hypothetical protein Clacol_008243 [Clathrus columnatus]|uniref:Uncharacterized protein n=1 Tax=Clathrus columnatus TaxID=1419009 RepID=A0AAV5ANJ6_9AGAM|nr:hypothetical protein Clacol_008243 [Clathrus columnatus]
MLLELKYSFSKSGAVYLIFRFLTGFAGSALLSVAAGSIADMYNDASLANPMATYTLGPFLGPVIGPGYAGLFRKIVIKNKGRPPPEARLLIGMAGAVIAPISLFWLAFTTYPHVHWIVPILSTILLGVSVLYTFTSIFTFLVAAYRPYAASAMAGNSFMRSIFAAAFPLIADAMYHHLGTVGATALLAGLTTLLMPLPQQDPTIRQN